MLQSFYSSSVAASLWVPMFLSYKGIEGSAASHCRSWCILKEAPFTLKPDISHKRFWVPPYSETQAQQIMLHKNRDSNSTRLSLQATQDTTWTGITFLYKFLKKNILWKLVKAQSSCAEQTVSYRLSGNHITAVCTKPVSKSGDNVRACETLTIRHSFLSTVLTCQMPNFIY